MTGVGESGVEGGGSGGATIVAVVVAVSLAGKSSDTVTAIEKVPGARYTCVADGVVVTESLLPSPQLQRYDVIVKNESDDLDALTVIGEPACPEYGPSATAVGPTMSGGETASPS